MIKFENNIIAALSEDHVCKVAGLTKGQLRAWDRRGFFQPEYAYDDRSAAYSRIYSFKDVVGLKTISTLRDTYKIGFKKLREVADRLKERGYDHWADTTLYVLKKDVHFRTPGTNVVESLEDGQFAMLAVIDVIEEVSARVTELKSRAKSSYGEVERSKFVTRNSWVVSGTRIPTAALKRYHDAGYSVAEILEEYPTLTEIDVSRALEHEKMLDKSA